MAKKTYIGYDEFGNQFDVKAEIQGYLDEIASLKQELAICKTKCEVKEVKKEDVGFNGRVGRKRGKTEDPF